MYNQEIADAFNNTDCLIFLDTNLLAWSFQLNDAASHEFMWWLSHLAGRQRLVIPAWTVHEYNYHLREDNAKFFLPHKTFNKRLKSDLEELDRITSMMISDASAASLGYQHRENLFSAIAEASKILSTCADRLTEDAESRKNELVESLEHLIKKCGLKNNIHEFAKLAAQEAPARYSSRLSPGYQDKDKTRNSNGDLIIWKEVLEHCHAKGIKEAIFLTNDSKSDWVYSPKRVTLLNGKEIYGSNPTARLVKLPNPDLVAEFESYTGSSQIHVLSIEAAIGILSSEDFNPGEEQDFRHLSLAVKQIARTPTEKVVHWFFKNPNMYVEALEGVCRWEYSPDEVDIDEFKDWTVQRMNIKSEGLEDIGWNKIFCELFL